MIDTTRSDSKPSVVEGHPVFLNCPVSGHPFPTLKWLKDGSSVETNDQIKITENGQALEILDARKIHSGRWVCIAENDAGVKELEIDLDVWTAPTVSVTSDSPIKAIGDTVTLLCNITGNPQPSISWNKAGQPIINSPEGARISLKGTRLDIPHLTKDDVGDYTCFAQNEAGTAEASIHVDVLVPPVINRDDIDMSPRLPAGQTLTLVCDAGGKPPPTNKWLVNDTEITGETEGITLGSNGKYIQINNVTLQDKGVYSCISTNVAGNDSLIFNVDVVQAPIISNGGAQQVIEGELAKIECLAEGHPEPQISWLRNGIRVETGAQGLRYTASGKVLNVFEARSSDSGIYVCTATNEAGTAQQAYTLEILVSPKIVTVSQTESNVAMGSAFSLKCGVRGYPEPEITWTENERAINGEDGYTIDEDGTLHVQEAKGRDLHYRCIAKNDAGSADVEYSVNTISAPMATGEDETSQNATEGNPATIRCNIDGDMPQISWQKNGMAVLPSTTIDFSEDRMELVLKSVRLSDEGVYICTAINSAGNATHKTILYVGGNHFKKIYFKK
ncbi:unnamed protein product [Auanema sp. JU1783]|nr:unnamed protein product [Auanema sp. JU1783]